MWSENIMKAQSIGKIGNIAQHLIKEILSHKPLNNQNYLEWKLHEFVKQNE